MMERPISLIILGAVAVVLLAGTLGLLLEGRQVPDQVWILDTAVVTFLYGHGSFLAQNASHARVISDLLDAVQTGATAATASPSPTPTNSTATSDAGHHATEESK